MRISEISVPLQLVASRMVERIFRQSVVVMDRVLMLWILRGFVDDQPIKSTKVTKQM